MLEITPGICLTWLTRSTSGCGYMPWISLFCRAVGSWVASVMMRKIIVDSCALGPQYLSLGTRVTATLSSNLEIL